MSFFRKAFAGIALTFAAGLPAATSAMPLAAAPSGHSTAIVQDVRYVCDQFGCYDRPDGGRPPPPPPGYGRPPPPGYYRPGPPPGYGRPPPPRDGWNAHIRWCFEHHRDYDPGSNRYIDREGRYRICRSPFR